MQGSFQVGFFFPPKYSKQMLSWSDFRTLRHICSGNSFLSVRCPPAWRSTPLQGNAACSLKSGFGIWALMSPKASPRAPLETSRNQHLVMINPLNTLAKQGLALGPSQLPVCQPARSRVLDSCFAEAHSLPWLSSLPSVFIRTLEVKGPTKNWPQEVD